MPRIRIIVPTFRRAEQLDELLALILARPEAAALNADLLVVDNDSHQSAAPVARRHGVAYAAEPVPGIAANRERGLRESQDYDVVVMIDDDVVPGDAWLTPLVEAWDRTRAAAISGYVQYVWPADTPRWIELGGYMRRSLHVRDEELDALETGNVLLDVAQVRDLGVHFDVTLGASGGEDTRFGYDLLAAGGRMVACSESVAVDRIPHDRATRGFVLGRMLSHGKSRVALMLDRTSPGLPKLGARARALGGAVARIAVFSVAELASRVAHRDRPAAVFRRRRWSSIGMLMGAFGARSREYARRAP